MPTRFSETPSPVPLILKKWPPVLRIPGIWSFGDEKPWEGRGLFTPVSKKLRVVPGTQMLPGTPKILNERTVEVLSCGIFQPLPAFRGQRSRVSPKSHLMSLERVLHVFTRPMPAVRGRTRFSDTKPQVSSCADMDPFSDLASSLS
ncbi:uncharacterized protein LOC126957220 [Macaca thibetana thibetana]|uniref:uncharacterized protein LOC126957220 n=1 Tax=Macaca thibetana thibetana TaxID=257877 RepID=UPI0021BC8F72|nr:uncharacterized protein LOC126957220 [Macaca thibetana thibetana]